LVAVTNPATAQSVKVSIHEGFLPELLSYDQNSHTNQLITQHFLDLGVELKHTFRSTSLEILLHMALLGEGTAVLPYLMVRQALAKQQLVITAGPIARPIIALEHKDKETVLPLLMLCNTIQKSLEQLNGEDSLVS
jgi:DNA-binding transcriptional LysR family regulator